ncbi:hypothetical protein TNCV_5015011 [Trichonephila clavipes]|nr:hypothetical protein TNCV_5015011 [Trichonephila clavipes]
MIDPWRCEGKFLRIRNRCELERLGIVWCEGSHEGARMGRIRQGIRISQLFKSRTSCFESTRSEPEKHGNRWLLWKMVFISRRLNKTKASEIDSKERFVPKGKILLPETSEPYDEKRMSLTKKEL